MKICYLILIFIFLDFNLWATTLIFHRRPTTENDGIHLAFRITTGNRAGQIFIPTLTLENKVIGDVVDEETGAIIDRMEIPKDQFNNLVFDRHYEPLENTFAKFATLNSWELVSCPGGEESRPCNAAQRGRISHLLRDFNRAFRDYMLNWDHVEIDLHGEPEQARQIHESLARLHSMRNVASRYINSSEFQSCFTREMLNRLCAMMNFENIDLEPAPCDTTWPSGLAPGCRAVIRHPQYPKLKFVKPIDHLEHGSWVIYNNDGDLVGSVHDDRISIYRHKDRRTRRSNEEYAIMETNTEWVVGRHDLIALGVTERYFQGLQQTNDSRNRLFACSGSQFNPGQMLYLTLGNQRDLAGDAHVSYWRMLGQSTEEGLTIGAASLALALKDVYDAGRELVDFVRKFATNEEVDDPNNPGNKIPFRTFISNLLADFSRQVGVNMGQIFVNCRAQHCGNPAACTAPETLLVIYCSTETISSRYGPVIANAIYRAIRPCFSGTPEKVSRCLGQATVMVASLLAGGGAVRGITAAQSAAIQAIQNSSRLSSVAKFMLTASTRTLGTSLTIVADTLINQMPTDLDDLQKFRKLVSDRLELLPQASSGLREQFRRVLAEADERLGRFRAGVRRLNDLPDEVMRFINRLNIPDAALRANIIDYLKNFNPEDLKKALPDIEEMIRRGCSVPSS